MSNFIAFNEAFKEKYGQRLSSSIYEFIESTEVVNPEIPFNGRLIENADVTEYDSYGVACSTLKRIFYFEDYDINVLFEGYHSSYDGEEWNDMREVKIVTKTIDTWE